MSLTYSDFKFSIVIVICINIHCKAFDHVNISKVFKNLFICDLLVYFFYLLDDDVILLTKPVIVVFKVSLTYSDFMFPIIGISLSRQINTSIHQKM